MEKMKKTYAELMALKTFQERLDYLCLKGTVGSITFGGHRNMNQMLYQFDFWKRTRSKIILRDNGFDLACEDHPIGGPIYIHHINPITIDDIVDRNPKVFDPQNLISCSFFTHNQIHYGDGKERDALVERKENDTCPWR